MMTQKTRLIVVLLASIFFFGSKIFGAEPVKTDSFQFASPIRLATASCTDFPWVSDLPLCLETVDLFKRISMREFRLSDQEVRSWSNGSSDEFLGWLEKLADRDRADTTLVLYFVTHQLADGSVKFSRGTDLSGKRLIDAINHVAGRFKRVLFINDCCYGAALEKQGEFMPNVIRLYATGEDSLAYNLNFRKGPYGLDEFAKNARNYLKTKEGWEPEGMTFFGLIALKAGLDIAKKPGESIDLQTIYRQMLQNCELYDDKVRQTEVQRFILLPAAANFEILKRSQNP